MRPGPAKESRPDHGAVHGARRARQFRPMQRERENTPTSSRPSPPPRAERESRRRHLRSPSAIPGRRPGRRDCAARPMARSQANGVSARRLREMKTLEGDRGRWALRLRYVPAREILVPRPRPHIPCARTFGHERPPVPHNPGVSRMKLIAPQVGRRSGSRRWRDVWASVPFAKFLSNCPSHVMAGLVPAIHEFFVREGQRTWMPGTSPGMTMRERSPVGGIAHRPE